MSGQMASGKSLVSKRLVEHHGFQELAFATTMKRIAKELWPLRTVTVKDRWLLIQLGERLRKLDGQVWIQNLLPQINPDRDTVVSDMRFPLEYEALERFGFTMVRMYIERSHQVKMVRELYPDMPLVLLDDESERSLDSYPFTVTINNNAEDTLDEIHAKVDRTVEELRRG